MKSPDPLPVCLCDLPRGSVSRLHDVRLDAQSADLLRALGLTGTSEVRLCKTGEPCIFQVGATRIGVSHAVAGQIFVIPQTAARR